MNERVEQLEKKVAELEKELRLLRSERTAAPAAPSASGSIQPARTASGTPPLRAGATEASAAPLRNEAFRESAPTAQPETTEPPPRTDWEHLIARVWLPRIFIVVLLVGIVWGFTAAVNAGIITEPVRCLLGAAASVFMYWQGRRHMRLNRPALGQVLLGGAVAVLLLSLAAAHLLYGLLPATAAMAGYALAIGLGLWTAIQYRSQTLTIIMMVAGYLAPFLLETARPHMWSFIGYETLFSIAMLLLAHRYAYTAAYYTALGLLHAPLFLSYAFMMGADARFPVLLAVLVQHAAVLGLFWRRQTSPHPVSPAALFTSFGLTAAWSYGLFGDADSPVHTLVLGVCAAVYSGVGGWQLRQRKEASVFLAAAALAWFLWLCDRLDGSGLGAAALVEGTLALLLGIRLNSRMQQVTGALAYGYGLCAALLHPIQAILSIETATWLILLASIAALYLCVRRWPAPPESGWKQSQNSLLWVGAGLLLVFLTEVTQTLTKPLSYDAQHLVLSAVWAAYAIAVIVAGVYIARTRVRLAGILLLFITLIKIIFVDLPDVSAAVRAVLFIGLGSVGVAVSRLFYNRRS